MPPTEFAHVTGSIQANSIRRPSDRIASVVSLNIARESDSERLVNAIRTGPRLREADVCLLQEVSNREGQPSVAEEAARKLGYRVSFVACDPRIRDQGLAILSPYEIADVQFIKLKTCELHFNCRTRFALSATVQAPFGNVRAWNVHLDTRINPKERIEQLQPVIDEAARQPGPRLIGGDFNTNGLYWFGNLLPVPCGAAHSIAIRKTMRQRGFETPFPDGLNTFRALHRHLDWIFLSGMEPLEAGVEPTQFSDHNAIWVRARS